MYITNNSMKNSYDFQGIIAFEEHLIMFSLKLSETLIKTIIIVFEVIIVRTKAQHI